MMPTEVGYELDFVISLEADFEPSAGKFEVSSNFLTTRSLVLSGISFGAGEACHGYHPICLLYSMTSRELTHVSD